MSAERKAAPGAGRAQGTVIVPNVVGFGFGLKQCNDNTYVYDKFEVIRQRALPWW